VLRPAVGRPVLPQPQRHRRQSEVGGNRQSLQARRCTCSLRRCQPRSQAISRTPRNVRTSNARITNMWGGGPRSSQLRRRSAGRAWRSTIALETFLRRVENPRLVVDPPPYRVNQVFRGPLAISRSSSTGSRTEGEGFSIRRMATAGPTSGRYRYRSQGRGEVLPEGRRRGERVTRTCICWRLRPGRMTSRLALHARGTRNAGLGREDGARVQRVFAPDDPRHRLRPMGAAGCAINCRQGMENYCENTGKARALGGLCGTDGGYGRVSPRPVDAFI